MKRLFALLFLCVLASAACVPAAMPAPPAPATATPVPNPLPAPANPEVILATTTSTQDSGLLDVLVPDFEAKTGYRVKVIAVGTGAALAMGKQGDADVLLVHAPTAEMELVHSGDAVDRRLVMHNDFILVGPEADPAGVRGTAKAADALRKIAQAQALFVSRGDGSGTHKMELALWKEAGLTPQGAWYQETGQGMGTTLKIASEKGAYTLTDRATFLPMQDSLDLAILLEGDQILYNVYHVMVVNPAKHPGVNYAGATAFADYLTSPEVQEIIGAFGKDRFGQPLFFPNAERTEP